MTDKIIITDPIIVSYYKENTHIDIVTMNHIFIDILKNLSTNLSTTINTTINNKILNLVTELNTNLTTLKLDFMMKLMDSKKEYIEDIKTILNNNTLTNNEKITNLIEKQNDNLLSKTTLIINDVVPKSQDKNYIQIESCIKNVFNNISNDTKKLLELTNNDERNHKSIINNIELQLTKMISSIQQPIINYINSSEDRTTNNIAQIKENLLIQNNNHTKLSSDINEFLSRYKNNSQFKGGVTEFDLYYMLQSIMPTDEIIKVSSNPGNCDVKVTRQNKNKPTILFESKDYLQSVPTEEVQKFERDLQLQKTHGILVSQNSPVTYKNSFQIDIINGLIHVYIPSADYSIEKVKIAIDIVDNLDMKLKLLESSKDSDAVTISSEDVDDIVEEYRLFGIQKSQMLDTIKLVNKQLIDKLEDIQLPKIKNLLIKLGNIENDNGFKCTLCNNWTGKNKASLGAHVRNCKFNAKNIEQVQPIENIVINTNTPIITSDLTITPTKLPKKTRK